MTVTEMLAMIRFLVDDAVETTTAINLLNMGQNKMAVEVKANFPQLSKDDINGTFVFPEKYHDLPVLYAAAMFKAYDSSIREKDSFMNQFLMGMPNFTENYTPPFRYWDDYNVAQFRATGNGTQTFTITKSTYFTDSANPRIYINDVQIDKDSVTLSGGDITIPDLINGDYITVIWETHYDINKPPFEWWEGLP